jgi:hypothetical protein
MKMTAEQIKALASRFANLPSALRVEIARRLLVKQQEAQDRKRFTRQMQEEDAKEQGRESFIEQFRDEVEKSWMDDFRSRNPFATPGLRLSFQVFE